MKTTCAARRRMRKNILGTVFYLTGTRVEPMFLGREIATNLRFNFITLS